MKIEKILEAIQSITPENIANKQQALEAAKYIDALSAVRDELLDKLKAYTRASGAVQVTENTYYGWKPTVAYKFPKVSEVMSLCKQLEIDPETVLKVDTAKAKKTDLMRFAEETTRKTFGLITLEDAE